MKYQRIFDARYDTVSHTDHRRYAAWNEDRSWRTSSTAQRLARFGRLLLDFVIFLALFFGILTACGFVLSQLDKPIAALPATTLVGPSGRAPFPPALAGQARTQRPAKINHTAEPMLGVAR